MKKLALGFLSVFMILGSVLFAACDKKVSLTLLTSEEITIVTNDDTAENFEKDTVEVLLENSSFGIAAEVLEGDDVVKISDISARANGRYSFDIETLETKNSGKAKVKVYSIEDESQSKIIYVNIDTILGDLTEIGDDNIDAKSNRYVIKSPENDKEIKVLNVEDYFELYPASANVYDILWTFEDGNVEFVDGNKTLAKIENNELWVSADYNLGSIVLKATDQKKGANNIVELDVLNQSTIYSFVLAGDEIYKNGSLNINSPLSYELVRNNVDLSNLTGEIVVDSKEAVSLIPSVTLDGVELERGEWSKYFTLDLAKAELAQNRTSYQFVINAYDSLIYNRFGDLKLDFRVEYDNYTYFRDAGAEITLETYYQATGIEVFNENGETLNNSSINIFSNYVDAEGYLLKTILMPDDVGLINDSYVIVLENNPENIASFYYRGRKLSFSQNGNDFVSEKILNGSDVYVIAEDDHDAVEDVKVRFIPVSNQNLESVVDMNFYKISEGDNLNVSNAANNDEKEFFISSSLDSARQLGVSFKISGLKTATGISVNCDNENFVFPAKLTDDNVVEVGEDFIILSFEIGLDDYNFQDSASFSFKHISGKTSADFVVNAFIPLQSVSISNGDKAASNVLNERTENQAYVLNEGVVEIDAETSSNSLSKIMLEAGTTMSILVDMKNATLNENGVEYRFLTYESLVQLLRPEFADDEDAFERFVEKFFVDCVVETENGTVSAVEYISTIGIDSFLTLQELEAAGETYFSINNDKLVLNDKEFKGIVVAIYNGYDQKHNEKTLLRFFTLESFYKVTNLSSNVETAKLYTTETLSQTDIDRASVWVSIALRSDAKVPTYSNDLSLFTFISGNNVASGNANPFEGGSVADGSFRADQAIVTSNGYYTLSDFSFVLSGRMFKFKITANSTKLQTQVRDILKIIYFDVNGFEKETEIQIEIQNVKRIESVEWVSKTENNEIYFNLNPNYSSQKEFTIMTAFTPNDANDASLHAEYVPVVGNSNDLDPICSSIGQTINVSLLTDKGGYGYLYLLPNDMIKVSGAVKNVLLYKYTQDSNGDLIETPIMKPLSQIADYYEQLVDENNRSNEFDQYFYNNEGEKIYYKNLILKIRVTIADGSTEEMAVRLYSQSDLESISNGSSSESMMYYEIMNNITLEGWRSLESLNNAVIFGKNDDVTLSFADKGSKNSESLFKEISGTATIRDLTLTGLVSGSGFVAEKNRGAIENVDINVFYQNGVYNPSVVTGNSTYTGAFVGENYGRVVNSNSFGVSIGGNQSYAGGIAGYNVGTILGCGVEFYDFENVDGTVYKNTITGSTATGGFVGLAGASSKILKSYVYAYSLLADEKDVASILCDGNAEDQKVINKGAFMAQVSAKGAIVEESFAYLGSLANAYVSDAGIDAVLKNSYLTYYSEESLKSAIYDADGTKITLEESDIDKTSTWSNLIQDLEKTIWEVEAIDREVNFGFMYLKENQQSKAKDVSTLSVQNVIDPYLKVLNSGNKESDGQTFETGIFFAYDTVLNVADSAERSALESINTIYLTELFKVSEEEAESLLITTKCKDIVVNKNSIRLLNANLNEFEIQVHSKMDFSDTKIFRFVILNSLPKVTMLIDGQVLKDGQTMLLQSGLNNARSIVFGLDNSIYLGGNEFYETVADDYTWDISLSDENINKSLNGQKLSLTGLVAHSGNAATNVIAKFNIEDLTGGYNETVADYLTKTFNVSVFNGATSLVISDAEELSIKPSEFASFEVVMETDNSSDNLLVSAQYGEIEIVDNDLTDNYAKLVVDSCLTLNISWTASTNEKLKTFNVLVSVANETKNRVDKAYDLTLYINAESLKNDERYLKSLPINIKTQDVTDLDIMAYNIESRQIKNSVLYLTNSNNKITSLAPSSDAILSVVVDPAYALMTHFTLTYSLTKSENSVGNVNISKLGFDEIYGFYANSVGTALIQNGLRVNVDSDDRAGNGVYYFRIYVSGAFDDSSDLKLTLNIYNGSDVVKTVKQILIVDSLESATVAINDTSGNWVTNYIMPKGSSAQVVVTIDRDQELYDVSLQNNGENISLSAYYDFELTDAKKIYTYTLTAYVNATLANGKDSGEFHVVASVARMINGKAEIKTSSATIYLVDFAVNASETKVSSSGATAVYNGQSYDVFYAYINSTDTLSFDYSILPEEYIFNSADAEQVELVKELEKNQNKFLNDSHYKDENADYYINYSRNEQTGEYKEILLRQQLSYVTGTDTYTRIHNGTYFVKNYNNDIFDISEDSSTGALKIKGTRSGRQLMRLQTTVVCQGVEFVYEYYFLVVVEVWSDEEAPTQITSGEQFVEFATQSDVSDDYILMNDIVLENYTPVSTEFFDSLDGNGYTIHLNSFAEQGGNNLELGLFSEVAENTTLKNVRVNVYGAGEIDVDINQYSDVKIAGFAIENKGIIYNCEVVSYFDENYHSIKRSNNGIVVSYMQGANTDAIEMTNSQIDSSSVSGFVDTNNGSITNSRVGGESFKRIVNVDGTVYIKTEFTDVFEIVGQGEVSGFVRLNGTTKASETDGVLEQNVGYISASYVANVQINNDMFSATSLTAGFAIHNFNDIQASYVEGKDLENDGSDIYFLGTDISAKGYVSGFVYENDGLVKNSYANIAINSIDSRAAYVSGFVYKNNEDGEIKLCFAACKISDADVNEMKFSGVNAMLESLNEGIIEASYYYNLGDVSSTEIVYNVGPLPVSDMGTQDTFYGFSFASSIEAYDGIWSLENKKLSLVSANNVAISNRYPVTTGNVTSLFYSKNVIDSETLERIDLSYGSHNNPIIIRNAEEFAKATGKAAKQEISSYKEYYNDKEVYGNYRLVNNIIMSEIDQNAEGDHLVKLDTTRKTFSGLLDGNGFTISNISLGSNDIVENYGLFAKLENSVIMSLNLIVDSIHNKQANIVGTLAGTAIDSRILAINISPLKDSSETSIFGNNVVGGVVGMIFGESKIHDVTARNMTVYSSYNQKGKTIGSNDAYIGQTLRELLKNKDSLVSKVSNISYAGAIVGYADIYSDTYVSDLKFVLNPDVTNFNIVTAHVYDSVDIYAEVAGGLFGYVGPSTSVYDASIQLSANDDLISPSYIISKNLYAGGLVGENYGVLFGSYASYEKNLQEQIELEENGYYHGKDAERGQSSIFSYSNVAENDANNANNPLFVGGLVGYMGSGSIYVAYNKLNVVSNSQETKAVGGIIGFAGYSDITTEIAFTEDVLRTNVALYDVYSSGDVYVNNQSGVSAGMIGAMHENTVLMMKNALAVNYLDYQKYVSEMQTGDAAKNHYMIIGKIFSEKLDEKKLSANVYLLNSENGTYNLYTNESVDYSVEMSSFTVGGYFELATNEGVLKLNPYGFESSLPNSSSEKLIQVTNIGKDGMEKIETAYAQLYSFFLPNGWSAEYWEHKTNRLFPSIQLLPKIDVLYLDAIIEGDEDSKTRARDVLSQMKKNSNATVVVRGRIDPDNSQNLACIDVDLTLLEDFDPFDFSGRLVSYNEYNFNDDGIGRVTAAVNNTKLGGKNDDVVGIILNKSMFTNLSAGASIEGLSFYLTSDSNVIDYCLVEDIIDESQLANVNLVYNSKAEIRSKDGDSIGLIAREIESSTLSDIDFKFRNDNKEILISNKSEQSQSYLGVIAGKISQNSAFAQVAIQDIDIYQVDAYDQRTQTEIDIRFEAVADVMYAGVYAGLVQKIEDGSASISMGLAPFDNIRLSVNNEKGSDSNIFVGGYAGKVEGIDGISLLEKSSSDGQSLNTEIEMNIDIVHCDVNEIFAGLMFGSASATRLNFINPNKTEAYKLNGGIYQAKATSDDATAYAKTKRAHIGGIAGEISATVSVSKITVDFNVGKEGVDFATRKADLAENQTTYVSENTAYVIEGNYTKFEGSDGLTDQQFGAYFGNSKGKTNFTGNFAVSGLIDVAYQEDNQIDISIGGMVGKSSHSVNLDVANCFNTMDYVVNGSVNAYVGGIVGWQLSFNDSTAEAFVEDRVSIKANSGSYYRVTGNAVSNVKSLKFGGAIGYVDRTDWDGYGLEISDIVYGGAVKFYGESIDGGVVSVGGVVGEFETDSKFGTKPENVNYSISECYSYGDVFVNYDNGSNVKLNSYSFGGIVGVASYVNVAGNYSLMTSFNNRLSGSNNTYSDDGSIDENWDIGTYNVNAIVGKNAEVCTFGEDFGKNYYNSGVCLAYQEESGNVDAIYAKSVTYDTRTNNSYLGYTSDVSSSAYAEDAICLLKSEYFGKFGDTNSGSKLNPYVLDESKKYINANEENSISVTSDSGKTHNISWVAVTNDFEIDTTIADSLKNVALVGNGHTITHKATTIPSTNSETETIGGIVNSLGNDGLNFNIISNLMVELDISADFAKTGVFGGVAGNVTGNSYIYAVAVSGEASIGGACEVGFGGIVGKMNNGFINECAMTANLLYRANARGSLSGVGAMVNGNTTIKATYTSGKLETYVAEIDIYALANGQQYQNHSHDIVNCYSISNIKRSDVSGTGAAEGVNYLLNTKWETTDEKEIYAFQTSEIFYIDSMNINSNLSGGTKKTVAQMALGYAETTIEFEADALVHQGIVGKNTVLANGTQENDEGNNIDTSESLSKWYFNPYVNFGFASHGFGYMKNVTTYTRQGFAPDSTMGTESETAYSTKNTSEDGAEVCDYAYTQVGYLKILDAAEYGKDWYLGVLNSGKFEHMIEAVTLKSDGSAYVSDANKNLKFVLVDDFVINNLTVQESRYININKAIGNESLVIDGDNHTIDFDNINLTSGIFAEVNGTIENVKFNNVNIAAKDDATTLGALAGKMTGTLNNVAVVGAMTSSGASYVGGVVGVLNGSATAVDAVVNVTNSKAGSILGGVVGWFEGSSNKITYSTNNGILISKGSNGTVTTYVNEGTAVSTNVKEIELTGNTIVNQYASITGGVVGYANGGSVTYSYNTNAVLDGYTTTTAANYIAGGVIGYAAETTIDNCYNTGLVGAGNYSNKLDTETVIVENQEREKIIGGIAFAGGIVGYGSGTTASNCINDGAVEAIGYTNPEPTTGDNADYQIATEVSTGSNTIEDWNANPGQLEYNITLTYNPGDSRQVFAYGIGYIGGEGGSVENTNSSSTENIKNDGNIGQISDEKTMTFDRATMLGQDADNNYKGKFKLDMTEAGEPHIYVNGYDSYSFPARIYIKDVMTRGYFGNEEEGKYSNIIEKLERTNLSPVGSAWIGYDDWVVEYNKREDGSKMLATDNESYYDNEKNKRTSENEGHLAGYGVKDEDRVDNYFEEDRYVMAQDTEYYESVSFVEYDSILKGESAIGLLANVNGNEQDQTANASVNDAISAVDALQDSVQQMKEVSVNGQSTAVVYTGDQLFASYNANYFKVELDKTLDENGVESGLLAGIDTTSLRKNSFEVSKVFGTIDGETETKDITDKMQLMIVKQEDSDEDGDLEWVVYGYFAQGVKASSVSINVTHTVTSDEITLGNNNIVEDDQGVKIYLKDNKNDLSEIEKYWTDSQADSDKDKNDDGIRYDFTSIMIGDNNYLTSVNSMGTEETGSYMILDSSEDLSSFNGQTLSFSYDIYRRVDTSCEIMTSGTEEKKAEFAVSSAGAQTLTFVDYVTRGACNNANDDSDICNNIEVSDDVTVTLDLEQFRTGLGSPDRVVVGPADIENGGYSITYNDGAWSQNGLESLTNLVADATIENNILTVTCVEGKSADVENMLKETSVWYSKSGDILSEKALTQAADVETTSEGIKATITGSNYASSVSGFESNEEGYGIYTGNDFASVATAKAIGGVTFYEAQISYSTASAEKVTIENVSGGKVGYDIEIKSNDIVTHFNQGVFANGGKVEFENVDVNATITVNHYASPTMTNLSENMEYSYDIDSGLTFDLGEFSETSSEGDVQTSYSVFKTNFDGSEGNVCPYCVGECSAITTQRSMIEILGESTTSQEMSFITSTYVVYSCGVIEVEYGKYIVENQSSLLSEDITTTISIDEGDYKKYVVKKDQIGDLYIYEYDGEVEIEDIVMVDGAEETNITEIDEKTEEYELQGGMNLNITWTETNSNSYSGLNSILAFNDNKVDVIVGDYDEQNIYFIKADIDTTEIEVDGYSRGWEKNSNSTQSINLYYSEEIESEYNLKDDNLTDISNLRYRETTGGIEGRVKSLEADNEGNIKISESRYGEYSYVYYYEITKAIESIAISETNWISVEAESGKNRPDTEFVNVYVASDLSLDTALVNENGKNLYGDENIVKFASDGQSLISINSSYIAKLNVVGSLSLQTMQNKETYYTIVDNSDRLQKVNFYGNVRNASLAPLEGMTDNKNTAAINLFTNSGEVSGVTNNISVTSISDFSFNDISDENSVTELTINDYISNNVIIVADGAKGDNGADGEKTGSETYYNGESGAEGGVGGSVTVNTTTFKGVAKAGLGGMGGYGGNGIHGQKSDAKIAGGGGAPGWTGESGSVTGASESALVLSSRKLANNFITKQFGGNGGVGAVGSVDSDNTSTQKENGVEQYALTWNHSKTGGGSGGFVSDSSQDYDTSKTINGKDYYRLAGTEGKGNDSTSLNNYYDEIRKIVDKSDDSETTSIPTLMDRIRSKIEESDPENVYIEVQVNYEFWSRYGGRWFGHYEVKEYKIILWTDGSTLNKGGAAGYSKSLAI